MNPLLSLNYKDLEGEGGWVGCVIYELVDS